MKTRTRESGYTLIELMIVVAVIGVLAAVAIPSFSSYLMRARTTEAVTFLGEIRQRQEAYRAEFGSYCSASASTGSDVTSSAWNPTGVPSSTKRAFVPNALDWDQLGASPDGLSYFQYRTTAGPPGTNPGVPGYDNSQFWFVAQARGDLDDDSNYVIFETYSASTHIFIGDGSLSPLPQGWE